MFVFLIFGFWFCFLLLLDWTGLLRITYVCYMFFFLIFGFWFCLLLILNWTGLLRITYVCCVFLLDVWTLNLFASRSMYMFWCVIRFPKRLLPVFLSCLTSLHCSEHHGGGEKLHGPRSSTNCWCGFRWMTCISVFVLRDVAAGEPLTHTCFFVLRDVAAGGLLTHACSFM